MQKKQDNAIRKRINPRLASFFALCGIFILIILRDPRYFTAPRFWAEEGAEHFAFAYSHPWWQAIFHPLVGYLNFFPNLATILATLVPLENAPLITTLAALIVQLIPVVIILDSTSTQWKSWWRKILGCAVVLFFPLTNEGWLNSINSYTFLAVVTFLILLEDIPSRVIKRWGFRVILTLAGLSGVLSCSLIPFYFLCAWVDKSRERWIQTFLLTACAFIHFYIIFSFRGSGSLGERFSWIGFSPLGIDLWTQSFLLFTTGFEYAKETGKYFLNLFNTQPQLFMLWGKCLLVAAVALIALITSNLTARLRALFLGSLTMFLLLSLVFTIIPDKYLLFRTGIHQRAFLPSNTLLGWMLLTNIHFEKGKRFSNKMRWLVSLLCAIILTLGIFWGAQRYFTYRVPQADWYDWRVEVAKWRSDPDYMMRIQPAPWVMTLIERK